MFAYCYNDPINWIDNGGEEAERIDLTEDGRDDSDLFPDHDGAGKPSQSSSQSQGGRISATASGSSSRWCPNPWGRTGSPAHSGLVSRVADYLSRWGYSVTVEKYFPTPSGEKTGRYADIYAQKGSTTFIVQVGRITGSGIPVARERRAIEDLVGIVGEYVFFIFYN